jgi:hypothetical protein
MRRLGRTIFGFARVLLGMTAVAMSSSPLAAQHPIGGGYATDDPEWRFVLRARRVKVVMLAGSIGAFQDHPYARHLHEWCENAEIRNLSRVGYGAHQLYDLLQREVLANPRVPFGNAQYELWLLWHGGLNSAQVSFRTNHHIRRAFRDAHRRGMRVVGLSLTPWGTLDDDRRWGGTQALDTYRSTRRVVDFVMGRLDPHDALGPYASYREVAANAPWTEQELADVRIDLYDSPLRDRDAPLRDWDRMRALVAGDARWRRLAEPLPIPARELRLADDARLLAELPRWFLRSEYRGFDAIHPNREGHRVIAELVCPRLPASWSCTCP